MPDIENVPVPLYQPSDPYHHIADNVPIIGLIERVNMVNAQVEVVSVELNAAIGSQGTLANRLAQSINDDGTLKTSAIDNALHSIAEHIDADGYVRMQIEERSKLSFIASAATSLNIAVETPSTTRLFTNEEMVLRPSDSITWRTDGDNVFADTYFPASAIHRHYYGIVPAHQNTSTPDYQNYKVNSVATPYAEGSLRVYVNGVRVTGTTVYVPIGMPGVVSYLALSLSEDTATDGIVSTGQFSLSSAIPSSATLTVDFDIVF